MAISPSALARLGWTRVDGGAGKIGARWEHRAGWTLRHCGHPTANHPWLLTDANGFDYCVGSMWGKPDQGHAWNTLTEAVGWHALEMNRRECGGVAILSTMSVGS